MFNEYALKIVFFISNIRNTYNENMIKQSVYINIY